MIPKKIHYCWFGGRALPDDVKAYMETWKKYFPDFEIKQWDESNFDVNAMLYTRQAYYARKFAFVSDVARLKALKEEGGLYLDTDILIKKTFPDEWFDLNGFGSFEHDKYVQTGVMAAEPNHPLIFDFYDSYRARHFFRGLSFDFTTNVAIYTKLAKKFGFEMNNTEQTIDGFTLFPQEYLCANDWEKGRYDTDETYAVHDFGGSWGKEALKSFLKFKIKSAATIIGWRVKNIKKHQ